MAKLNLENFSESYQTKAPMECGVYLFECIDAETQAQLRADWNDIGGVSVIPFWKYCYDNLQVRYEKPVDVVK